MVAPESKSDQSYALLDAKAQKFQEIYVILAKVRRRLDYRSSHLLSFH